VARQFAVKRVSRRVPRSGSTTSATGGRRVRSRLHQSARELLDGRRRTPAHHPAARAKGKLDLGAPGVGRSNLAPPPAASCGSRHACSYPRAGRATGPRSGRWATPAHRRADLAGQRRDRPDGELNNHPQTSGTFHCGTETGGRCNEPNGRYGVRQLKAPASRTGFHTYSMIWDKRRAKADVSAGRRQLLHRGSVPGRHGRWNAATSHGYFLLLNVAIGGGWPGQRTAHQVRRPHVGRLRAGGHQPLRHLDELRQSQPEPLGSGSRCPPCRRPRWRGTWIQSGSETGCKRRA